MDDDSYAATDDAVMSLFAEPRPRNSRPASAQFPTTRYQGSKRKLAGRIVEALSGLEFISVLDAFGGTGAVSYAFKAAGKQVTYNDVLRFNHQIALALIENDDVRLTDEEIDAIAEKGVGSEPGFIERTFAGVYFTGQENRWLDCAVCGIQELGNRYKRALAWYAVFQSALMKRPYNLFHRRNLYMRTASVRRSFGNKVSWDAPFGTLFRRFARQANAAVIESGRKCTAICGDALALDGSFDLVYIDPPYFNGKGTGVNYQQFYHFLEGLVRYDEWSQLIDRSVKHLPLKKECRSWCKAEDALPGFRRLFERFRSSILVISYRSNGIPNVAELVELLSAYKRSVEVVSFAPKPYALSTCRNTQEVLLIGH